LVLKCLLAGKQMTAVRLITGHKTG
jgi:hypothetical protein